MPKSKPTQVIVHRLELQDTERDLATAYVATKSLENVSKSIQGIGIGVGMVVVTYFGIKVWQRVNAPTPPGEPLDLWDLASDPLSIRETYKKKGILGTIWEVGTTPLISPKKIWNWATE